jgi:hypothetical protein
MIPAQSGGVFTPGEHHIRCVLELDADLPAGVVAASTHYLFQLRIPTPGAAARTIVAALTPAPRRRR